MAPAPLAPHPARAEPPKRGKLQRDAWIVEVANAASASRRLIVNLRRIRLFDSGMKPHSPEHSLQGTRPAAVALLHSADVALTFSHHRRRNKKSERVSPRCRASLADVARLHRRRRDATPDRTSDEGAGPADAMQRYLVQTAGLGQGGAVHSQASQQRRLERRNSTAAAGSWSHWRASCPVQRTLSCESPASRATHAMCRAGSHAL